MKSVHDILSFPANKPVPTLRYENLESRTLTGFTVLDDRKTGDR
ncbi:MAG: hypothetical protein Q7V05_08380 [Methanoregula sp.]|nr:hypothetical protein [Methanoregula sp.]